MKSTFLKKGKILRWFDVWNEVRDNAEKFTNEDIQFILSQCLAKEDWETRDNGHILFIYTPPRYGMPESTTMIYKYKGKFFIHDNDETKAKMDISRGDVRVVDIPYELKAHKVHKKSNRKSSKRYSH